jgi:predicted metal-dependent hydrolase
VTRRSDPVAPQGRPGSTTDVEGTEEPGRAGPGSRVDAPGTIRARRVSFDWSGTELHWIAGDPVATHVINVLHLLLPAGERWFCAVYRQALPLVNDQALRADVKGFIGQEAVHARAHQGVLDHLAEQGIDTGRYTRLIECLFNWLLRAVPRYMRPGHHPGAEGSVAAALAYLERSPAASSYP